MRGLPFQPCFNLERTSDVSFRGSISGLGFAYCEFTRHNGRTIVAHSVRRSNSAQPLGLRPSLAADNKITDLHSFAGKIMHVVVACA